MAASTGKSRKGSKNKNSPSCQRYTAEKRWQKHKERKGDKHESKLQEQTHNIKIRKDKEQQAIEKFQLGGRGTYILKRILGTTNIKRLDLLLSGNIIKEEWFKQRKHTILIEKLTKPTKFPKEYLKEMNNE